MGGRNSLGPSRRRLGNTIQIQVSVRFTGNWKSRCLLFPLNKTVGVRVFFVCLGLISFHCLNQASGKLSHVGICSGEE